MNIPIIASRIFGIAEALEAMGFNLMHGITFVRAPMRVDGVWHAEVRYE